MVVNVVREKQKTNIRTHSHDEAIKLTRRAILTLETAIEFIADDELVEVTPASLRVRKRGCASTSGAGWRRADAPRRLSSSGPAAVLRRPRWPVPRPSARMPAEGHRLDETIAVRARWSAPAGETTGPACRPSANR